MSDPRIAVAITADDKTAKGAKSAERRLGQIPKHASAANAKAAADGERRIGRHSRAIVRTFGEVEKAGAKLFGARSLTGGVAARMSELRGVSTALGSGLGEAAVAGGVLEGTLGAVGVAAAGTTALLAGAAFGAFKLADGFAKGAVSVGNLANLIGVSTKALTEFQAAAERVGVDKQTAAGALGGISQTLNDARYGRNPAAQALLAKLGVGMRLNGDGTVNVEAMLPALADALKRQNSSGRRTAARALGISDGALAAFTQGGAALSADMRDADKNAMIITDQDVTVGRKMVRRHAQAAQWAERNTIGAARRAAAGGVGAVEDYVLGSKSFGNVVSDTFKPATERFERAVDRLGRAATGGQIGGELRSAGRFTAGQIASLAKKAQRLVPEAMGYGFSRAEAIGIAANVQLESGGNHRSREAGGRGPGRGLIQWTDPARKALFRRIMGVDVEHASRAQQWQFLRWETEHSEARNWQRALGAGQDPATIAAGYARYVERPADKPRDSAERAAVAEAMTINLEVRGLPAGASVKATGGQGARPAVSYGYAPVHGG